MKHAAVTALLDALREAVAGRSNPIQSATSSGPGS
jgi:ATP phosphoribosyltransferase